MPVKKILETYWRNHVYPVDIRRQWMQIFLHRHTHEHTDTHTHEHTHTHTYIYIYFFFFFGSISSLIHFWLNIIDIFCQHIFFVNPLELPYWSYDIRRELVDKPSIISYFPSTFCPTLVHHQGRMSYKSDITFVCKLLLCKNEHLYCCKHKTGSHQ